MKDRSDKSDAEDAGWEFFKKDPELLVAAVWHVAAKQYPERDDQMEFVNGYINARRRADERRREDQSDG